MWRTPPLPGGEPEYGAEYTDTMGENFYGVVLSALRIGQVYFDIIS